MDNVEIGFCIVMGIFVLGHLYSCLYGTREPEENKKFSIQIGVFFVLFILTSWVKVEGLPLYLEGIRIVTWTIKYVSVLVVLYLSFQSFINFKGD